MKWIYKLEYKYGRYAIENLMYYIIGGMAVVFIMDIILSASGRAINLCALLAFDRNLIFHGQIWRLVSFIFLPPNSSPIFMIFALYLYYLMGSSLEQAWSSFRFNAYYFTGIICTIIFGLITGYTTNVYLNMSLFFAFAMLFPDFQLMIFFILPVKVKYLAMLDAVGFIISLIVSPFYAKVALLVAVGNFLIFFWDDFINRIKLSATHIKSKRNFNK